MMNKKSHGAANVQPQDLGQSYDSTICPGCTIDDWQKMMAAVIRYNRMLDDNWDVGPVITIQFSKHGAEVLVMYKDYSCVFSTDPIAAKYMVSDEKTRRFYDPHLVMATVLIVTETDKLEVKDDAV